MPYSDKEKLRDYKRKYYKKYIDKYKKRQKAYAKNNPEKRKRWNRGYTWRVKVSTILAYGSCCACCGESNMEFLQIDHIHGGGKKHLRSLGLSSGTKFYLWLKKQGYPKDDFRVLCGNCNFSRGMYGYCPHQEFD